MSGLMRDWLRRTVEECVEGLRAVTKPIRNLTYNHPACVRAYIQHDGGGWQIACFDQDQYVQLLKLQFTSSSESPTVVISDSFTQLDAFFDRRSTETYGGDRARDLTQETEGDFLKLIDFEIFICGDKTEVTHVWLIINKFKYEGSPSPPCGSPSKIMEIPGIQKGFDKLLSRNKSIFDELFRKRLTEEDCSSICSRNSHSTEDDGEQEDDPYAPISSQDNYRPSGSVSFSSGFPLATQAQPRAYSEDPKDKPSTRTLFENQRRVGSENILGQDESNSHKQERDNETAVKHGRELLALLRASKPNYIEYIPGCEQLIVYARPQFEPVVRFRDITGKLDRYMDVTTGRSLRDNYQPATSESLRLLEWYTIETEREDAADNESELEDAADNESEREDAADNDSELEDAADNESEREYAADNEESAKVIADLSLLPQSPPTEGAHSPSVRPALDTETEGEWDMSARSRSYIHRGDFRFINRAFWLENPDEDQQQLLNHSSSWYHPNPGSRFPGLNLPIDTIREIKSSMEHHDAARVNPENPKGGQDLTDAQTRQISAPDNSEEFHNKELKPNSGSSSIGEGADSRPSSEEEMYDWSSSPERAAQNTLPHDESTETTPSKQGNKIVDPRKPTQAPISDGDPVSKGTLSLSHVRCSSTRTHSVPYDLPIVRSPHDKHGETSPTSYQPRRSEATPQLDLAQPSWDIGESSPLETQIPYALDERDEKKTIKAQQIAQMNSSLGQGILQEKTTRNSQSASSCEVEIIDLTGEAAIVTGTKHGASSNINQKLASMCQEESLSEELGARKSKEALSSIGRSGHEEQFLGDDSAAGDSDCTPQTIPVIDSGPNEFNEDQDSPPKSPVKPLAHSLDTTTADVTSSITSNKRKADNFLTPCSPVLEAKYRKLAGTEEVLSHPSQIVRTAQLEFLRKRDAWKSDPSQPVNSTFSESVKSTSRVPMPIFKAPKPKTSLPWEDGSQPIQRRTPSETASRSELHTQTRSSNTGLPAQVPDKSTAKIARDNESFQEHSQNPRPELYEKAKFGERNSKEESDVSAMEHSQQPQEWWRTDATAFKVFVRDYADLSIFGGSLGATGGTSLLEKRPKKLDILGWHL